VKKHYSVLSLITLIPVLLSCNFLSRILPSQKSLEETPAPTLSMPVLTETPAIQISRPCPIPDGTPPLFDTSVYEEVPGNLVQYLNSDGNLETLLLSLDEAGMVTMDPIGWVEDDFTGDGFNDIAILLHNPEPEFMFIQGTLILNQCKEDHYEIVFQSTELMDWGAPEIFSSEDLNGDQVSDLLVGRQSCGAHTCFTQIEALLWNGETMQNQLQGTSDDMPSPTIEVDPETKQITLIAEGIGSVGAGPFRRFLRKWTWDEELEAFLPSPDTYLPSNFRIHVLQDADQAAEKSEYGDAIALYTRVIEDDELLDYLDSTLERPQLGAYASFRLMLTYLLMNDVVEGEATHASIMTNYPADSPASDFIRMADIFWSEYEPSSDIGSACLAAQAFAASHQETILDALYYGYANPAYEAQDICPFTD
jgi:hypothetical protein